MFILKILYQKILSKVSSHTKRWNFYGAGIYTTEKKKKELRRNKR